MNQLEFKRSSADPCLCYRWTKVVIIAWLSWIDDCLHCGKKNEVEKMKTKLMHDLEYEDIWELNEHVGVKIETKENRVKLTQPELIQSLNDEVDILP